MFEEFFDIAVINFDKYVLHGRIKVGRDEFGVNQEKYIEQELTREQKRMYWELERKHRQEFDALLASFVVRD